MKYVLRGMLVLMILATGCALYNAVQLEGISDEGTWEVATLKQDEYGAELQLVRQNDEVWLIEAKTYCFWTRQYVGRQVWLKWGPVQCWVKNDNGDVCEFWTKERIR